MNNPCNDEHNEFFIPPPQPGEGVEAIFLEKENVLMVLYESMFNFSLN